jgi:uncharacterized membrane protein YbaN (DUF454 family)
LPPDDLDGDLDLHDSRVVRGMLIVAGVASVVLGVVGLVVPVMPTTPFLLVAATCFARASPSFYRRLVMSPRFGPLILEWRRHRSIPWRTKLCAIGLLGVSLTTSIVLFVRPAWLQAVMAAVGLAVAIYLYRIPSRDRPRH